MVGTESRKGYAFMLCEGSGQVGEKCSSWCVCSSRHEKGHLHVHVL